jgi:hypothetical protein
MSAVNKRRRSEASNFTRPNTSETFSFSFAYHTVLLYSTSVRLTFSSRSQRKAVPAGVSDIAKFMNPVDNFFYVDKSFAIPLLERASCIVVLLRPQRWGKTVFLNLLSAYYDVAQAPAPFVHISGGDTPLAHSFSILRFDLANVARALPSSAVAGTHAETQAAVKSALDCEVRYAVEDFIARYGVAGLDATKPALDLLAALARWSKVQKAPLYVLVDEYDAVLRSLQIMSGSHIISALSGRLGPLREFFGRLKSLHDSALLDRVFMTGKGHILATPPFLPCDTSYFISCGRDFACRPGSDDNIFQRVH